MDHTSNSLKSSLVFAFLLTVLTIIDPLLALGIGTYGLIYLVALDE